MRQMRVEFRASRQTTQHSKKQKNPPVNLTRAEALIGEIEDGHEVTQFVKFL